MDEAVSAQTLNTIREVIASELDGAMQAHDLRTRHAGAVIFIDFHLVVSGDTTVFQAHEICDRIEESIKNHLDDAKVTIHVEPEHKSKQSGAIIPV